MRAIQLPAEMPGVQGLQAYISRTASARDRRELKDLAKEKKRTGRKAKLLCDFFPVVEWLLSSYDGSLVRTGRLPPYSLLYGGDVKLYGQRVLAFVEALKSVGISPIFFLDGPPGSDLAQFEAQLPQLRAQHDQMLERCLTVHQVCEGRRDLLQVDWQLSQDVATEVQASLQAAGVGLTHCVGCAAREMIEYQQSHPAVLGALSTNTDLAVAAHSTLFPISFFDLEGALGVSTDSIHSTPSEVVCEVVDPSTLCRSLQLERHAELVSVSILCGNDFTHQLNESLDPCTKLGLSSSTIDSVSVWVRKQSCQLEEVNELQELLSHHPSYREAISQSEALYGDPLSGREQDRLPALLEKYAENGTLLCVEVRVHDNSLLSATNGIYWRWPVVEPVSLGQVCYMDLTLHLRRKVYSLLGQEMVREFGRTSSRSFTHVEVMSAVSKELCYSDWSESQRLLALFRLMTADDMDSDADISSLLSEATTTEEKGLASDAISVLPQAVLVCGSLCFMCRVSSAPNCSTPVKPSELEALLLTSLFCAASIPPSHVPELPSSRALTLAMQFSHTLHQARLLASVLGLRDALPPPSSLFYPLAYMPHHLAANISHCSSHEKLQNCSANLVDAYCHYAWLLNSRPVMKLCQELNQHWKEPKLKSLLELFAESLTYAREHSMALTPKLGLPECPSPHLQLCFEKLCGEEEEEEDSRESSKHMTPECDFDPGTPVTGSEAEPQKKRQISPRSDHDCNEMSSVQDCLVLEEYEYLSQSLAAEEEEGKTGVEESSEEEGEEEEEWGEEEEEGGEGEEGEGEEGEQQSSMEKANDEELDPMSDLQRLSPPERNGSSGTAVEVEEYITLHPPSSSSSSSSSPSSSSSSRVSSPSPRVPPLRKRYSHELPVMSHRDKILELLEANRVVCVEGETGCGKSTQIPQFILDHALSATPPRECHILVTQPRRVAAMKLAERVASERRERVGQTVGYCIGGEHHHSRGAALTYCTTGYLLQVGSAYMYICISGVHLLLCCGWC